MKAWAVSAFLAIITVLIAIPIFVVWKAYPVIVGAVISLIFMSIVLYYLTMMIHDIFFNKE